MCLQVKECQKLLAATRSYGKDMEFILPQSLRKEPTLQDTLILYLWLPQVRENKSAVLSHQVSGDLLTTNMWVMDQKTLNRNHILTLQIRKLSFRVWNPLACCQSHNRFVTGPSQALAALWSPNSWASLVFSTSYFFKKQNHTCTLESGHHFLAPLSHL